MVINLPEKKTFKMVFRKKINFESSYFKFIVVKIDESQFPFTSGSSSA